MPIAVESLGLVMRKADCARNCARNSHLKNGNQRKNHYNSFKNLPTLYGKIQEHVISQML